MTATAVKTYQLYINGRWVEAAGGRTFEVHNPATGEVLAEVADGGAEEATAAVRAAADAFPAWSKRPADERAELLHKTFELLRSRIDEHARILTEENGKPLAESKGEATIGAGFVRWNAEEARRTYGEVVPSPTSAKRVLTFRQPVGVVAAITPWNFPYSMITRKIAPALAAGCTVVAKPSDYTPVSALELAARIEEAGVPAGVFNVVTGSGPAVGQSLAGHPGVDKIAFTGSTRVGAEVARAAAANITGTVLELGGKSAHLVFDDADLDAACNGVVAGVFAATGQTCMAGSRLLADRKVHDQLVDKITARAHTIKVGDPAAAETEMGPLANQPQYQKVLSFLSSAPAQGATVAAGGEPAAELGGYFVRPTVLTDVSPQMSVACEEVFGPVLAVMPFDTEEEAIALANGTRYGLAGAVWTKDIHRGHRVAHALKASSAPHFWVEENS